MAIIYSYPDNTNILLTDLLIGTSTVRIAGKKKNLTKNFTVEALGNFISLNNPTVWGTIDGNLENQTDLWNALQSKQGNITLTTSGTEGPSTLIGDVLNIPQYSGGGELTLQQVTDAGNITTNDITLYTPVSVGGFTYSNQSTSSNVYLIAIPDDGLIDLQRVNEFSVYGLFLQTSNSNYNSFSSLYDNQLNIDWSETGIGSGSVNITAGDSSTGGGKITFYDNNNFGSIRVNDITANVILEFPNKVAGAYTIATTDDIPTIGTWGALNYPTWSSGTPFVKMTAAGTFALDTNTYLTTAVTSIGITVPPAFSVTPSSITTSGTFAITGAGTASQYIRGDGQLATFPTSGGGGSSVFYYLNGSVAASVATYKQMSNAAAIGTGTDFSLTGNGLIAQFLTDAGNPNRLEIPGGAWNFEMFFSMSSSGGTPKFYVELLKYDGAVFTSIANGSLAPETISGGTPIDLYLSSLAVPTTTLLLTDRLAIRVYIVNNSGGRTATLHTEDSHLCQIITTFSSGISAINGVTSNNQYLAVGTSGTDFNINSALETHTFNLPSASETARGLVTINGQTFAGAKTFSTAPILSSLTASQLLALDASKNVQSLDTATYPSLTELSYVKGVTSPIQAQLNIVKKRTAVFNNRSAWSFPANISPNPFVLVGSTNYELSVANVNSGTDVALTALGIITLMPIGIAPYNCKIKSFVIESRTNTLSYFSFPLRIVIGSNTVPQPNGIVTNIQVCEDFNIATPNPSGSLYNFKDTTGGITIPKGHGIIPLISFSRTPWGGGTLGGAFTIQIEIEEVI